MTEIVMGEGGGGQSNAVGSILTIHAGEGEKLGEGDFFTD